MEARKPASKEDPLVFDREDLAQVVATLRSGNDQRDLLAVFSWNVLADSMALTNHGQRIYSFCAPETVAWTWRKPRILEALASCGADIIMLQEIEPAFYTEDLAPLMQACGYKGEYEVRNKVTAGETVASIPSCATFFREELFELAWTELPYRGLVLGLKMRRGHHAETIFAVANSHLEGHPERTDHRHAQIRSVWKRIDKRKPDFMVLGGDYNDGAGSELCREHMRSLTNAYNGSLARDATCVMGVNPHAHQDMTRVDHLFFNDASLALRGLQNVMDSAWERDAVLYAGLPGYLCPSDHFSIAIIVELRAPEFHVATKEDAEPSSAEMLAETPLTEEEMSRWMALRESEATPVAKPSSSLSAQEKREAAKKLGLERRERRQGFLNSLASDEARDFVKRVEAKLKQEAKAKSKAAQQIAAERKRAVHAEA